MTTGKDVDSAQLIVSNLWVRYPTPAQVIEAVRGVSFTLGREKLGIVGKSGSGKSTVGRAILRLVPSPGEVSADRLSFAGTDLLRADDATLRAVRGRRIAMVMQDPKFSLNPVMTVGRQIGEACRAHATMGRAEARRRTLAALEAVRIRDPERVYDCYPHEVSGGMGQRVMIAMMLVGDPDILIADEPTSALDVTVQMQVLAILDDLVTARGMGLILISHDLNLVASFCDRVLIMYAGQVVETCRASALQSATHPYTRGLLAALPRIIRITRRCRSCAAIRPGWTPSPIAEARQQTAPRSCRRGTRTLPSLPRCTIIDRSSARSSKAMEGVHGRPARAAASHGGGRNAYCRLSCGTRRAGAEQ